MLVAALLAATITPLAQANDRLEFPADFPGIPAYARLEPVENGFHDGVWAAIPFYREPSQIRTDFNLMSFMDRWAALDATLLIEGFVIRDLPAPSPPKKFFAQGLPGMPVWFVRWDELSEAMFDDYHLTIVDILAMESLVMGWADFYHEEIKSGGRDNPSSHRIITCGVLEDGRDFWAHFVHGNAGTTEVGVTIMFR
jgi:hypothetical protein